MTARFLTVAELAAELRISRSAAYDLARRLLGSTRIGTNKRRQVIRIRRGVLESWIRRGGDRLMPAANEAATADRRERRRLKHSRRSGTQVSVKRRWEIFERDGFRCRYCGATPAEAELRVDHVLPIAKGGKNDHANLVTACHACNAGKADR